MLVLVRSIFKPEQSSVIFYVQLFVQFYGPVMTSYIINNSALLKVTMVLADLREDLQPGHGTDSSVL